MMIPPYLYDIQKEIEGYAQEYKLDFYDQVFEILDYKTMNEVAAYGGFPTRYPHWRFGMEYEQLSKSYSYGLSKIYEMVINNDPCYAYLLEGNSLVDQKLVISHVCAHNDFFKNNYYFLKTNRKMIDEMANHATRVRRHMERFGVDRVESFIDVCLSLDNLIDSMSMFIQREAAEKAGDTKEKTEGGERTKKFKLKAKSYMEKYINPPDKEEAQQQEQVEETEEKTEIERMPKFPHHPEKDVMKFLIEHGPLEMWQRDIMEIIREETYYFAPQAMTKIMNEGWATYWHSKIMTQKVLTDAEVIDYADHAAAVLGGGRFLNPYKIGVELLRYIEERWNKGQFGKEWEECDDLAAKRNWDRQLGLGRQKIYQVRSIYNDVMFIDEFFTEDFCREQLFYTYGWNERNAQWEIQSRQYQQIKTKLLNMLTHGGQPFIAVVDGNYENRGELLLEHTHEGVDLRIDWARDTLVNLYKVWRRPTNLITVYDGNKKVFTFDGKEHKERAISSE